jgi:hypothetical protein
MQNEVRNRFSNQGTLPWYKGLLCSNAKKASLWVYRNDEEKKSIVPHSNKMQK